MPSQPPRQISIVLQQARPSLPAAIATSVGFLTNQVAGRFRVRVDRLFGEHGLNPRHYLLLVVLRDEGSSSQQALGARAGLDRTTTMQTAQFLEGQGLLARSDDPQDRRVYRLALTEAGQSLVTQLEGQLKQVELEVLQSLSPADQATFVALLQAILADKGPACGC